MVSLSDTLSRVQGLWSEALGLDAVAADSDFFELGGDSVMVTIMTLQIEEAFDLVIDPALVFEFPVLKDYAEQIEALRVLA
jgi:acyl carrier protein